MARSPEKRISSYCDKIRSRPKRWVVIGGVRHINLILELIEQELKFQRDELEEISGSKAKKRTRCYIMRLTRLRNVLVNRRGS